MSVSGGAATTAIARLTGKRFMRSRMLLVAAVFAFLPLLPYVLGAGESRPPGSRFERFVDLSAYVQLLVAALLMAPAIAEEIEDKTYAYLWSRPIPRWSVLAGKLIAGSLIGIVLFVASTVLGSVVIGTDDPRVVVQAALGLSVGVVAVGCAASCFGTLMPKHPLPFSIAYFLVLDFGVGAMPFAGARVSVMHNVIAISGHGPDDGTIVTSLVWLLGLSAFWVAIALWRLGRSELSTGS